jgi:hypothetical protein
LVIPKKVSLSPLHCMLSTALRRQFDMDQWP